MSIRIMSAVWDLELPDSEKIVLLALADCADDSGRCWPSIAALSRKCSKGERTVQIALRELGKAGHLTRREIVGKGCEYYVHPRRECTPAKNAPRTDDAPAENAPTPAAAAPKPSEKHHGSEAKASSPRAKPKFEIPDWVPAEPWAAFVEMRKATGHKMTDHAKKLAVAELERLRDAGNDPEAVLNQSTMKAWRGLFEVKAAPPAVASTGRFADPEARKAYLAKLEGRDVHDTHTLEHPPPERRGGARPISALIPNLPLPA